MTLRVYNTLTRQKEAFETVRPGKVGMYVCGPTVYKPSHVGHMVGPVIFDAVKRYLTYLGYQVTFVVNLTDIDDKIIREAAAQKRDWKELAESVTADYRANLKQLGVTSIDHFPRATEHIGEIQKIIAGLIEKGHAYAAGGDVYFDVTRDPDYGKLCNRDPEQLEAGARIEVSDRKRNPGDFALWKGAKPGEPKWDSPWGPGRPGWHIECSAMSMELLGETLDIHGGGLDLQFPHHENELAQSESYTGRPFARYWMHNGLMRIRAQKGKIKDDAGGDQPELQKMSKSLGNEIVVREVLKRYDPETLRFLLLSTHYRSPIEYSEDRLAELKRSLESFHRFFERFQRITGKSFCDLQAPARRGEFPAEGDFLKEVGELRQRFLDCMDDDFNTGGAVGVLYELLTALNRFADTRQLEGGKPAAQDVRSFERGVIVLRELSQILGLFAEAPKAAPGGDDQLVGGLVQLLIDLRAEARKAKNFALGDQVRQRLGQLGITLEDRPGGTLWRRG
ncbi:MAG: cysteine--tRNA ligase [Gemmataceae bacterium]|nr:cysteine--tRNA ligase [Gemmataceae bacterium]